MFSLDFLIVIFSHPLFFFFCNFALFYETKITMMNRLIEIIAAVALVCSLTGCTKQEKTYYPDGHLQSSIEYKMGKEHGRSLYYYDRPNTLEIEMEMRKGKRNGEFKRYYENGGLDTYCVYHNDTIVGEEVMYLPNGTKTQIFTYKNGKRNGAHTAYHINGEVKIEGGFKDDMFDGQWIYYDERGVVVGEGAFKSGRGDVIFYDQNGQKARLTHYENNKKDGKEIYYNPDGSIAQEIIYKQDRIISQTTDTTKE